MWLLVYSEVDAMVEVEGSLLSVHPFLLCL